jgi:hypothetical protein
MRYHPILLVAILLAWAPHAHAKKFKGLAILKDSQTAGVKDKEHKHQAYDLSFEAQGKSYTCRTDYNKSMNATDFVIGTQMKYEIDGNKAKIESHEGKKVDCKIVRVEASTPQ